MSPAKEIEDAIRTLEETERNKLLQRLPQLLPEIAGDLEWERIIRDAQSRAAFSKLLDRYETDLSADRDSYPKVESDFD